MLLLWNYDGSFFDILWHWYPCCDTEAMTRPIAWNSTFRHMSRPLVIWPTLAYFHLVFVEIPVLSGPFLDHIYLSGPISRSWRIFPVTHLIYVKGYNPTWLLPSPMIPSNNNIHLVLVLLPVRGVPSFSPLDFLERSFKFTGQILLAFLDLWDLFHIQIWMILGRCGSVSVPWTGTLQFLVVTWT